MPKSGIDFFPLDVRLDNKFELIEAEFGLTGFGVIVHLLMEIYGQEGYYIEWTNEVALLFAKKIGAGVGVVSEIVEASVRRGMFDKDIFDKYQVLTSRGIQKRYFEAVSRRKELEVDENILLVSVAQICPNANIKRKNVNILSENVNISEQSKVKESKVNNSSSNTYTRTRESDNGLGEVMTLYFDKINASPSPTSVDLLKGYVDELGADVVIHALNFALDENKRTWSYINAILQSYSSKGLNTLEKLLLAEQEYAQSKREKSGGRQKGKSSGNIFADLAGRDDW